MLVFGNIVDFASSWTTMKASFYSFERKSEPARQHGHILGLEVCSIWHGMVSHNIRENLSVKIGASRGIK
jgi:hypothetical protein